MASIKLTRNQQVYAAELAKSTGLSSKVVAAWLAAEENGPAAQARERTGNNNWLNIGPGRTYATPQQGAAAAAKLLRSSGYYKGIRASAKTGNAGAQADAIAASPWDAGHYAEHGGNTLRSIMGNVSPIAATGLAKAARSKASSAASPSSSTDAILSALTTPSHGGGSLKGVLSQIAAGNYDAPTTSTPTASTPKAASSKGGIREFDGKPVAGWIADVLDYARQKGWHGTVTSGYRSDAEQKRIYDSGVRPAAKPRSEGGGGSNHSRTGFLQGAIDVTDAPQLNQILKAKGSRLQWAGAKDPVHFSVPRNGSY